MNFAGIKSITLPEGTVTKILQGGTLLWKKPSAYKNWVFHSTEADGVTIYNNGKGYKDGTRVRSGGAEAEESYASCTGYIPYVKGDVLYIYPPFFGENKSNTVNFYDSKMTCLGQVTDYGAWYGDTPYNTYKTKVVNGVSVLDISSVNSSVANSIAFVRIGNDIRPQYSGISSGAQMIITKNETFPLL